jgi:hypothetical protein
MDKEFSKIKDAFDKVKRDMTLYGIWLVVLTLGVLYLMWAK